MSTKPNKLKKGLLLSTAALILSTPVCMAQSALASTGGSSSFVKNQSQPQLQTALAKLQQILPKTSQGLRSLSSNTLPSDTEISSLETILATYKEEVQSLQAKVNALPNPDADPELTSALSVAKERVSTLEDAIAELKAIKAAYEAHQATLKEAVQSYNEAVLSEQKIQDQYQELIDTNTSNEAAATAAREALTVAETNLTNAQTRLNQALNDYTQATNTKQNVATQAAQTQAALDLALNNYTEASNNFQTASTNLATAQSEYDVALDNFGSSDSNLLDAFTTLSEKKNAYNSALSSFNEADASLTQQTTNKNTAQQEFDTANENLDAALDALDLASSNLSTSNQNLTTAETNLFDAQVTLNQAQQTVSTTAAQLATATSDRATAAANLSTKLQVKNTAQQELIDAAQDLNTAQNNYDNSLIPDPTWTAPTYQKENIRTITNTRQVEVKTLVPRTETVFHEQVIPNLLFNSDFSRSTEGWSGVNPGWQGSSPALIDGEIIFSYQDQTVSQGLYSGPFQNATLTLSADWFNNDLNNGLVDNYSMTVVAKDIDQNPVGSATYTSTGAHDWERKSITLTATGPVSYVTVSFSGIDNGFWYGIYGPHVKNPTLNVTHGDYVTQTVYDEVITYEEETYYTYETYYTTEPVPAQTGLTVRAYNQLNTPNPQRSDTAYNLCATTTLTSINHDWGGGDILGCGSDRVMLHYTGYITPTENITSLRGMADDGFYLDVDGVNVINNWTTKGCGGNWNPVTLQAGRTYAIDAWFFEWGGGACSILNYQSTTGSGVVPEAWYTNAASAPMIKDPAKLQLLIAAQAAYNTKLSTYSTATANYNTALADDQTAANNLTTSQNNYNSAVVAEQQAYDNLLAAQETYDEASAQLPIKQSEVNTAVANLVSAQNTYQQKSSLLSTATSNYSVALSNYNATSAALDTATQERNAAQSSYNRIAIDHEAPTQNLENATAALAAAQSVYDSADALVDSTYTALQTADEDNSQNQIALTSATKTLETSSAEYSDATSDVSTKQVIKDDAVATLTVAENAALESQQASAGALIELQAFKELTKIAKQIQQVAESKVTLSEEQLLTKVQKISTTKEELEVTLLPKIKTKVTAQVEKQTSAVPEELPKEVTADNLQTIDLTTIDPTTISDEQAEELKEAALETFETATQGSPEYEQALDALFLAAQVDDIVISEELAAIPGAAALVDAINFLGNAGADMSPKVREESEKIVVTAVVAAGVAVQAAAGAATSAAVSAGGSTGSSGSRRVGK